MRSRLDTTHGSVLILGATSGIAKGISHSLANRGHELILAGRGEEELSRLCSDLEIRYGVQAFSLRFDALDSASHADVMQEAVRLSKDRLAGIVVAFGILGDQERAVQEFGHAREIIDVNFLGIVSAHTHGASYLEAQRKGFIVAISSVSGDRGRQSNYTYGAAKGGLMVWLQGLRNRLHEAGVHVLTVKPGFVDTRMTYGMPGLFLVADPAVVGERVVRAVEHGKQVLYVPRFWRLIMLLIRLIPEVIFRRLKL